MGLHLLRRDTKLGGKSELRDPVGYHAAMLPAPDLLAFRRHVGHSQVARATRHHPGQSLVGPATLRSDERERVGADTGAVSQHHPLPSSRNW